MHSVKAAMLNHQNLLRISAVNSSMVDYTIIIRFCNQLSIFTCKRKALLFYLVNYEPMMLSFNYEYLFFVECEVFEF